MANGIRGRNSKGKWRRGLRMKSEDERMNELCCDFRGRKRWGGERLARVA